MRMDISLMQGKMSGAFFGTDQSDTCKGLATNRYDWQIVTALSKNNQASNGVGNICHIIKMNEKHEIGWSKEFGNGFGGNRD